ncbi:MAG: hypothetical protein J6P32_05820, partial [Stomatobaculum sp.]|nr:hypothetical protein [Stomatobaculum sp.]
NPYFGFTRGGHHMVSAPVFYPYVIAADPYASFKTLDLPSHFARMHLQLFFGRVASGILSVKKAAASAKCSVDLRWFFRRLSDPPSTAFPQLSRRNGKYRRKGKGRIYRERRRRI